jgi:hypothetical protein
MATKRALVLALLIAGCGGDADVVASLELRVDLPAAGAASHALVEVGPELGGPFDTGFPEESLASVPLASSRTEDAISVVTSDAGLDVKVRVRFCGDAACADATAPAQRFVLRDPFYAGERTFYRIFAEDPSIDVPDPVEVDRCQIRGCVEGDLSSYCDGMGMHLCEGAHPPGPMPGAVSARVVEL